MVDHYHGLPPLTMWIWLWWAMLIMFHHSLLWHYCIAMLIIFCLSHCNIRFCLSHCDIKFCSSHVIVRLWSSNYDEGFFIVTLWCWNRFLTIRLWAMFVTLRCWEIFISLQCWSTCVTLPHSVVYITLRQWVVFIPLKCLEMVVTTQREDTYFTLEHKDMLIALWWQGYVCHIATSNYVRHIATSIYVRHIATLLCLVDWNIIMFDTLWPRDMCVTLQLQSDVQHIATSQNISQNVMLGYVHHNGMWGDFRLIPMLFYVCHISTFDCVQHIATVGCIHPIVMFQNVFHNVSSRYKSHWNTRI